MIIANAVVMISGQHSTVSFIVKLLRSTCKPMSTMQKHYCKKWAARANVIDTMDIVWAIDPKNDLFENTLQRMQYFAGELLSGKNILLQFYTD
jgi:hypothetical protein